jgi:photosystem II stability/assembly factor-like uncharacterized protein
MTRTALLTAAAFLAACLSRVGPAPADAPPAPNARVLDALTARPIGPANTGGRISAVAVVESNPDIMYIGAASGGVWKTADGGNSWTPVFERQGTSSIGDVAVAPSNPDVIWVGTGEANPRNSVSWGDGVYRSTDGGKSWKHLGLKETHHIGRIVVHPKDPDTAYVAALGRVWGPNKERGLYKTADGGKTWKLVKFIDADTGFIDVALDPSSPDTLYAAAYCVRRDAFAGGNPETQTGPGAGLYKTTDGGKTWERLTRGLPRRPFGRCGVSVSPQDPRVVYAVVQTDRTSVTVVGQTPNLRQRVLTDPFGRKFTENLTAEHGGVFRSQDGGRTWAHVNSLCPRPFYYGQIRADPGDPRRVYVLGVAFYVSTDSGRTFSVPPTTKRVHADHHALWINPKDPRHLVLGNDGGLYFTRDRGATWEHVKGMPIGQFYGIAVDMRKPYRVYGGLQDNGSWGGPSATGNPAGITLADWQKVLGGDGFQCQADPTNPDTVYCEMQYGRSQRIDLRTRRGKPIQPKAPRGAAPFRFNWSGPLLLSPHDARVLYFAGNHVFRSLDRGDSWRAISPDLTRGGPGLTPHTGHTICALAESPLKAGVLYAGTDDGRLHVTRNAGKTWVELTRNVPGVPAGWWVSRVECSHFAEGAAYLALDRHRQDDRRPYLFSTSDHGKTWESVAGNLPEEGPVYVVRESSRNRNLLFAGTEVGVYASLDAGKRWHRLGGGLPTVPVHDLVIHPRDRELVIGTHGRSLYVMDIAPLEELTPKVLAAEAHLFGVRPATAFRPRKGEAPAKGYVAPNAPFGATLWYYLKAAPAAGTTLTVLDRAGKAVAALPLAPRAGLQRVVWDLRPDADREALVPPGEYTARLQVGATRLERPVRVDAEE